MSVAVALVEGGVVDEVLRCGRLPLGDEVDEGALVGRQQGVVVGSLVADGGPGVGGQVLPAGGPGTVGGVDAGVVGERHQLVVEAVVELVGEFVTGEADAGQQVGPADVADEEGVAGEHGGGLGVVGVFVHDDAHRFRGVAGGVAELEGDLAERDAFAVGHRAVCELRRRHRRVDDRGAGRLGEFEVSGQEVGVEVRLDHELDGEAVGLGIGEVFADVAAGIDHHRTAGGSRRPPGRTHGTGSRGSTA